MNRARTWMILATAGCSDQLPPNPQVILYVSTDAPLPAPEGRVE